ncbi:MAG: hypothetical protein GY716_10950 [bacterium]|nr:hypothetical protein [bacterium]
MPDACPSCSGTTSSVVTSVTVRSMGSDPKSVLVTRLCGTAGCHLKFPVLKPETELDDEERARWRD